MEPQDISGGRYRIEAVLGRGATATVYRVHDTVLDVPRAVKVLSGSVQVRRALRRRLYAEAKAMARLDHPNILRLYDIGLDGERDYVVMELADGGTLGQMLERRGPLPPHDALQFTLQILSALAVAHDHGIVHRDVKPENVLLNHSGTVLLADFGIALLTEDASRATRVGVTMGSLAYMPPEQRIDARSVGATADVYAVGATLYHLLTDENPIDLFTAAKSSARWSGIPEPLLAVLQRATHLDAEDRYSDARQMAQEILVLLNDLAVDASPLRERRTTSDTSSLAPSADTFLLNDQAPSVTTPNRVATDAAIHFLTAVPVIDEHFPTLTPDNSTGEQAISAVPTRTPLIAGAILAAGVFIAGAIALPGMLGEDTATTAPVEPVVETQPVAEKQPVVETQPVAAIEVPPEPVSDGGVAGAWSGSFSGRIIDIRLSGSNSQLSGTVTVAFGSNSAQTPVRGRLDAGMLSLTAYEDDVAVAEYALQLSEDGQRLVGSSTSLESSSKLRVSLKRVSLKRN